MRRLLLFLLWGVGFAGLAGPHELITTRLTWTEQVSRIFYRRCVQCHREGGAAPWPLTTYQQVRPWAKAIKYKVLSREMPPWGAVKGFGAFRNDASLSQEELAIISSWVEGGAPEGNPAYLPPLPSPLADQGIPAAKTRLVRRASSLKRELTVLGIRPEVLEDGSSLQAVAELPSGRIENLLWIRNYQPAFRQAYYFREPLSFPKGTTIRVSPQNATVSLLIRDP